MLTLQKVDHECNTIQNQKNDEIFIFDKINKKSIKIQLYRQWFSYCFNESDFAKNDHEENNHWINWSFSVKFA